MKHITKYIIVGSILILIYTKFNNIGAISSISENIFSFFSVFVYGGIIAFLLNPILIILEKKFKIKRLASILIIYITVILLIFMFFAFIIPILTRNITDLINNYPSYMKSFKIFIEKYITMIPFFKHVNIMDKLLAIQKKSIVFLQQEFSFLLTQVLGVTTTIFNFVLAIIFSIFFLSRKEYFSSLSSEILDQFLAQKLSHKIKSLFKKIERVFLGYISGKTIDSVIIGIIAMIGLVLLNIPYVILLGIFITLFNFIPYIGPLVGIVLGVTITIFTIPSHALFVLIFLILLQQFDAWVLEPRILGNILNLSMFWTIFAVILGGKMLGAIGIIIAVPTFALIKELYLLKMKKNSES